MEEENLNLIHELETYISFFRNRAAIQESYLESLNKLSMKTEEIDRKFEE